MVLEWEQVCENASWRRGIEVQGSAAESRGPIRETSGVTPGRGKGTGRGEETEMKAQGQRDRRGPWDVALCSRI